MTTPKTERRHQSLFYRDLASPISSSSASHHHRGSRFATPGQAAAVSSLWRENFNSSAPETPPPPVFTLDDRLDFTPETVLPPSPERNYLSTPSPSRPGSASAGGGIGVIPPNQKHESPGSWWSPMGVGSEEKGGRGGSHVEGVVHQQKQVGPLLMLPPPPREVARPETRWSNLPAPALTTTNGGMAEVEWITIYGFFPGDTNLVLREFEKCGSILKHIPGPRDANWMHILYQNRYDAQKALGKNGMQLDSALMIGVKPVDPVQRQYLSETINGSTPGSFIPSRPQPAGRSSAAPVLASPRPNHQQNGTSDIRDKDHRSTGAIASPAKSVVSKVMDLMFGL